MVVVSVVVDPDIGGASQLGDEPGPDPGDDTGGQHDAGSARRRPHRPLMKPVHEGVAVACLGE